MKSTILLILCLFISGCTMYDDDIFPLHTQSEFNYMKKQHEAYINFMEVCHKQTVDFYKKQSIIAFQMCHVQAILNCSKTKE